jgi:hypothetical protein
MTWVLYVDVSLGMALAVGVLVMAVLTGRKPPVHVVLWAIGLGLLTLRALLAVAIGVGILVASEASWAFLIGAIALVVTIPAAVLQPRWAGIALLISAILQPAILFVLGLLAGVADEEFPVDAMLGLYSLTVAIIGGVLIASTLGRPRQPERLPVPASAVSTRQSEGRVSGS